MIDSVECPYCGTQANHLLSAHDFNRRVDDTLFQYYKCPKDNLIFLYPIPENLGEYYPPSYYNLDTDYKMLHTSIQDSDGYKVDMLKQFAQGKRLLEVGPGNGGFIYLAQLAGYDVSAIEMDQNASDFLRNKLNVEVVNTADVVAGLESLGLFDAIVLWHVIEHMPDAWQSLIALSKHLAPNGVLILAAPNPSSLQFKLFTKWWTHLDAPRHVYLIPAELLEKIGKQNGLELVDKTDLDAGSLMWNLWGWRWSLRNLMRHQLQNYKVGYLIEKLISPLERRGFRSTTYTITFRKTKV